MGKHFREMNMSGMPLSRNIEDRRSAERKADDATLKPGEDVGNVRGPSHSWMKSPQDYGTPTKPDYGYDISTTKNYNAPEPKKPFMNDRESLPKPVGIDKTSFTQSTMNAVNASRAKPTLNVKEHCGCDKGHPEIKPVPVIKTIRKIVKQARDRKKYK